MRKPYTWRRAGKSPRKKALTCAVICFILGERRRRNVWPNCAQTSDFCLKVNTKNGNKFENMSILRRVKVILKTFKITLI